MCIQPLAELILHPSNTPEKKEKTARLKKGRVGEEVITSSFPGWNWEIMIEAVPSGKLDDNDEVGEGDRQDPAGLQQPSQHLEQHYQYYRYT